MRSRAFLLDTNLLVAAIKRLPRVTPAFLLVEAVVSNPDIQLVGDSSLLLEYRHYSAAFPSHVGSELVENLVARMLLANIDPSHVTIAAPYFGDDSLADMQHAAACLATDAILITNDRDFENLGRSGLVEVWSVSRALRELA